MPISDFGLTITDPPACTVGFLPPSQWRNPADTSTIDTPDGLYCKLPQDSPIAVRGARNYPCMGHPGKRAPTVELCNDPKGYQPLAIRQHSLGPNQFDPNLIAQGVPPDDRVDFNERIHAPVEGTPLPPGAVPPGAPPPGAPPFGAPPGPAPAPVQASIPPPPPAGNSLNGVPISPPAPVESAPMEPASGGPAPEPHGGDAVPAAPSAFGGNDSQGVAPSVAISHYDPRTGRYLTADGQLQTMTNLKPAAEPKSWKDLLPI
jgi:hypothetical protein